MEAIVDKAFGDILLADSAALLERPQISDAFVRYPAIAAGIKNRKCVRQPVGDVVGIENGNLRRLFHAIPAHHRDVCPGNGHNAGTSPRCRCNGAVTAMSPRYFYNRVTGKEGRQV